MQAGVCARFAKNGQQRYNQKTKDAQKGKPVG